MQPEGPVDEARLEAHRWLATAEEDLLGATAMLERDDVAPRLACFLAQQAAEKALKARLIGRGIAFPRPHDLLALRALSGRAHPPGSTMPPSRSSPRGPSKPGTRAISPMRQPRRRARRSTVRVQSSPQRVVTPP